MDVPTQYHLTELRHLLEYRLHDLRSSMAAPGAVAEVESALRRLDAGTFGDCLGCGHPIPLPRLFAQPEATHCAECQATNHAAGNRAGKRMAGR
jgi:RNA polymerase-binding transcription factor DksA